MLNNESIISIIIPTFNRVKLLKSTLSSIKVQSYTHWECLVIDDGSTDGTEELLVKRCNEDSRFRYIKRPVTRQKGASTCRNIGLELAIGKYILFFDSDDVLLPEVLESRMQAVLKNPEYPFHVFQTARFNNKIQDSDAVWNSLSKPNASDLQDFLNINPVWHTSGPIWSKRFLIQNNLCFTEGVNSWQDWEFHIRVLLLHPSYLKINSKETMVYQRFHEEEAINKLNALDIQLNRIQLLFKLIEAFKAEKQFDNIQVQKQFFKLFYFVIQKMPFKELDKKLWQHIEEELYLVPKLDVCFWKQYVHFKERYHGRGTYTFYKLLKRLKKQVFNKRFPVDDFSNRTWYQIKRN
ncbi:hypothetical protein DI383_02205 [Flavobacteriaceae bacterium LYZ1037]|nr:hypothetical protein DI383_02205 [Flavobacteriaceae bacterium LYZ1037]